MASSDNYFNAGFGFFIDLGLPLEILLKFLTMIILVLIGVAFYTLADRKVMAAIQRRKGPNVVGLWGLFQPIADGIKLILKDNIFIKGADIYLFKISPVVCFGLSLFSWVILPLDTDFHITAIDFSLLFVLTISALGIYGIICAGWGSNSKYPFLGALRAGSQMISYDICINLVVLILTTTVGSVSAIEFILSQDENWYIVPYFSLFIIFFISSLAETNRVPFDLSEAEAELVAGFNLEYSSLLFALFFLAEYSNMLLISLLNIILFTAGELIFLKYKLFLFIFLFIWVRATLPRFRYDKLMELCWKKFIPLLFLIYILNAGLLLFYL